MLHKHRNAIATAFLTLPMLLSMQQQLLFIAPELLAVLTRMVHQLSVCWEAGEEWHHVVLHNLQLPQLEKNLPGVWLISAQKSCQILKTSCVKTQSESAIVLHRLHAYSAAGFGHGISVMKGYSCC